MRAPASIAVAIWHAALALVLAFASRLDAQGAATGCRRGESPGSCYARALAIAVDSVRHATALGHAEQALRLQRHADALLRDTCAQGWGSGCYMLGRRVMSEHLGDPAGMAQAADRYQDGCFAHWPSAPACNGLADSYSYGIGRRRSEDSALVLFQRGCDQGNATACFRAGARQPSRNVAVGGTSLQVELADRACARGSPGGCLNAGFYREQLPSKGSPPEVVARLYRDACYAGQLIGCSNTGLMFLRSATSANPDSARFYFEWACTGRDRRRNERTAVDSVRAPLVGAGVGCKRLGDLFLAGKHVPADTTEALRWYLDACGLFETDGCVDFIYYRMKQEGGAEFGAQDLYLTGLACFEGNATGCNNLGALINSVFADSSRANSFFARACTQSNGAGCYNLAAGMETSGTDGDSALALYRRSCELRYAHGCWLLHQRRDQANGLGPEGHALRACNLSREFCAMYREEKVDRQLDRSNLLALPRKGQTRP